MNMSIEQDPLNLDIGWRIGEQNFREIVGQVKNLRPSVILEFGSGASSIRLSQAFNQAEIFSIDHDIEFFRQAEQLRDAHHVDNLHLIFCPLRWQTHGLKMYESYRKANLPKKIDAVIIDGPPHYTFNGREACLYQVYENLRIGGLVILDDFDRSQEKEHVANWLGRYPGSFERIDVGTVDTICIMVKTRDVEERLSAKHVFSSYLQLSRRAYDGDYIMRIRKLYVRLKRWLKGRF